MSKFDRELGKLINEELDLGYVGKRLMSKLRGVLKFFGLIADTNLLEKYPELSEMYNNLMLDIETPEEVSKALVDFLKLKPFIIDEAEKVAKRNIQDFSIRQLADTLSLAAEIEPDEEIKGLLQDLKAKYDEDQSDYTLRSGLESILNRELEKIRDEIPKIDLDQMTQSGITRKVD